MSETSDGISRRNWLKGAAALTGAAVVAVACTPERSGQSGHSGAEPGEIPEFAAVPAHGASQAGIERPETPQQYTLLSVLTLEDIGERQFIAELGRLIGTLSGKATAPTELLPDGPGDLAITVGLGPRLVRAIDPNLPGAADLPEFRGDEHLPSEHKQGDVLLALYSSDPTVLPVLLGALRELVPAHQLNWQQHGFRAPSAGTIARNPLGFHDGIIVPRGDEQLAQHVWVDHERLSHATICVIRQFRTDIEGFKSEPIQRQEAVIGRKLDGSPLSGGSLRDEADMLAKTPSGEYIVPLRSHARAANPVFTGSALMLRRGYAYDNSGVSGEGDPDAGLIFMCFQRDLRTFTSTQARLDEMDDLMDYVTPRATFTFLILPGFDESTPLGASLP